MHSGKINSCDICKNLDTAIAVHSYRSSLGTVGWPPRGNFALGNQTLPTRAINVGQAVIEPTRSVCGLMSQSRSALKF